MSKIVQAPDKGLKTKSKRVDAVFVRGPEFLKLIEDMNEAMERAGGVGIAAPQIGVPLQVALIKPEYVEPAMAHLHILINPSYSPLVNSLVTMEEGCLSIKEGKTSELVRRFSAVEVISDVLTREGTLQAVSAQASGFLARIVQHEVQHLYGYLIEDHVLGHDSKILNVGS